MVTYCKHQIERIDNSMSGYAPGEPQFREHYFCGRCNTSWGIDEEAPLVEIGFTTIPNGVDLGWIHSSMCEKCSTIWVGSSVPKHECKENK